MARNKTPNLNEDQGISNKTKLSYAFQNTQLSSYAWKSTGSWEAPHGKTTLEPAALITALLLPGLPNGNKFLAGAL